MSFDAPVTLTDAPPLLSLADGDAASGSKLGHLTIGSKRLPLAARGPRRQVGVPAAGRVGRPAADEVERRVTRSQATVNLRQQVKRKASGSYRKVVLVTLSTETP